MRFSCFRTQFGWAAVMSSHKGLVKLTLPALNEQLAIESISQGIRAERHDDAFTEIGKAMKCYFDGEEVDFDFTLDLSGYTSFQRDVWDAAKNIPYGQLHSYKWIAAQINNPQAARAVGQALGANPLPIIIPCHRIIRTDGSLGGFSSGLHWKERLISLEKAVFIS